MLTIHDVVDILWELHREQEGKGGDLAAYLDVERHDVTTMTTTDTPLNAAKIRIMELPAWELGGQSIDERIDLWAEEELAFYAYAYATLAAHEDAQKYLQRRSRA